MAEKSELLENILKNGNIPTHIAIIMDGNGRWAKKMGKPRLFGHRNGMKTVKEIVKESAKLGVKYLTLYAFSTENWNRPPTEVKGLIALLKEYIKKELRSLHNQNIKINCLGDIERLFPDARDALKDAIRYTAKNNGMVLNLALSYSGRFEILNAIKNIVLEISKGTIKYTDIDESLINNYLFTKGQPDPDLLIRTSMELRVSNFMLWQIAYTEFYFTDVLWPDFKEIDLYKAISEYQKRNRRFGGL